MGRTNVFRRIEELVKDDEILNEVDRVLRHENAFSLIERAKVSAEGSSFGGINERFSEPLEARVGESRRNLLSREARTDAALTEAIILLYARPVLLVQNDTFQDPIGDVWSERLRTSKPIINNCLKAIGRIELQGHTDYEWVGTGWLCRQNLVITNRHVAEVFAEKQGAKFKFMSDPFGNPMKCQIDFKEEYRVSNNNTFDVTEILYVAERKSGIPDVAILKISGSSWDGTTQTQPLQLATMPQSENQQIFVAGYPAWDGRRNNPKEMGRIFNNIYDVKRLQPGQVTDIYPHDNLFLHDCSTLGGNSGSPVMDLGTGEVIGLHYAGTYLKNNFAVSSQYLSNLISKY